MNNTDKNIAVIGSGPMGLACAYQLLKTNHRVDIYERDDRLGGMSACFDFEGLTIERYYHFICRPDYPLFSLLKKLDLTDKLRWRKTKMGFYYDGVLYQWGTPLHLLTFPKLDLISKLRYAFHIFMTSRINNWDTLDKTDAVSWLEKWVGHKAYKMLWDYLFEFKFYDLKGSISAAWIGTRIKRMALSRRHLFSEYLGYLEGGTDTLLRTLEKQIIEMGGRINFNAGVERIITDGDHTRGIIVGGEERPYNGVVSTVPLPYIPRIAPQLPADVIDKIKAIKNFAVVCVITKLRSPLSEFFWLNINDADVESPGLIEYTNLYPMPESIVYIPFYVPHSHPKYTQDDETILEEVYGYYRRINPEFSREWVLAAHVSRYEYAQPVCMPNYYQKLPPIQSSIKGFVMADTSSYYPEDRGISESVRMGQELADLIDLHLKQLTARF